MMRPSVWDYSISLAGLSAINASFTRRKSGADVFFLNEGKTTRGGLTRRGEFASKRFCFGPFDLRAQDEVANALRTATPE
jgi:hypothetical protein